MEITQNMMIDMKNIPEEFRLDDLDNELLNEDPIRFDKAISHMFTVKGTYAAVGGENGKFIEKPYIVEGIECTDEEVKKYGAVYTFLATVAKDTFPEIFPDFAGILTHTTQDAVSFRNGKQLDLPADVSIMDREQCIQYIRDINLPVDFTLYPEIGQIRQSIRDCIKDERAFKRQQIIKMVKRKDGPQLDEVRNRNQELIDKLKRMAADNRAASGVPQAAAAMLTLQQAHAKRAFENLGI